MPTLADKFCTYVADNPDMSHSTARLGAWMIGTAATSGGFPLDLTIREIQLGFERKGKAFAGMGGRNATLNSSIEWLTAEGLLVVKPGKRSVGFGKQSKQFTLKV